MKQECSWEEIYSLSEMYQISLPRMVRGRRGGETLGKGTGSSLEFQDYRSYVPGDDLRHMDWRAYGRSDALFVKLFREEIFPRVEIFLDVSSSMKISEEKATRAWETALFLFRTASKNFQTHLTLMGNEILTFEGWPEASGYEPLWEAQGMNSQTLKFHPHSIRYVISDFLLPLELDGLVGHFARKASRANFIQILGSEEEAPKEEGRYELMDIETGEKMILLLDGASLRRYKQRLANLKAGLSSSARQNQAGYVQVSSVLPLREIASQYFLPEQMVAVG